MSSMSQMRVEILSPEKSIFVGESTAVVVPGKLGYMKVLPGHAKMIAELGVGNIELTEANGSNASYFVSGGFIETRDDAVRILVDVIEKPSEINVERAKKSESRAKERLSGGKSASSGENIDYARAQAALLRAQARLLTSGQA